MTITKTYEIPERGNYDVIVAGGGVAGVAAANTLVPIASTITMASAKAIIFFIYLIIST